MAYEYDRYEKEEGGGSFLMGLLAGTVLGAGLGMLFAPKAGSDLRNQLGEQAGRLRSTANETYGQASDKVNQIVDRGREAYRPRAIHGDAGQPGRRRTDGHPVDRHRRDRLHDRCGHAGRLLEQPQLTTAMCARGDFRRTAEVPSCRGRHALMTEDTARKVANTMMGAAAIGAAYVVLSRPSLRRLAWTLALTALTGTVPAWFNQEVVRAWAASGRHVR